MKTKIAAIIPAYNEDKTIVDVINVVKVSELIDEVIVVSDGSTDKTVEKAKRAGADKVLDLPEKGGKGAALLFGVANTKAEIIVFLDADLRGFTEQHIKKLVEPVLRGQKVMVTGFRDRGKFLTKIEKYLPLIGGERALERFVIENIPKKYLQGFMVEIALNYYCRSRGLSYGGVFLRGLNMRKKIEKVGVFTGLGQYIKMYFQVVKAMAVVRLAKIRGKF